MPGDSIVGFISRGRGGDRPHGDVSEHSGDGARSPRFRAVGRPRDAAFPVRIHIMARNQKGSLADIAIVLRDEDVNIDGCLAGAGGWALG